LRECLILVIALSILCAFMVWRPLAIKPSAQLMYWLLNILVNFTVLEMSFRVLKSLWLLLFISGIILLIEAPIWLVSIIAIVHFVRIVPIIELILVLLTWLRISLMHSIVIKYLIMVYFLSQFNFLQSHNIVWIKTLDLLQILRHVLQRILLIQRNRIMTRTFSN
jgi:hypothetical protein